MSSSASSTTDDAGVAAALERRMGLLAALSSLLDQRGGVRLVNPKRFLPGALSLLQWTAWLPAVVAFWAAIIS